MLHIMDADQDKSVEVIQNEPVSECSDYVDVVSISKGLSQTFSIELQTCRITDKGIDLQVVKIDHVLSYLCICPQCGKGFPDKTSLKLHAQKLHEDTCYHDDPSQSTAIGTGTLQSNPVEIDTDVFEPVEINSAPEASIFPSVGPAGGSSKENSPSKKSARILSRQITMAAKGEDKPKGVPSKLIQSKAISVTSKRMRATSNSNANSNGRRRRKSDNIKRPISIAAAPSDEADGNFDDFALDCKISDDGIDNSPETSPSSMSKKSARILARQITMATKGEDKPEGVASKLIRSKAISVTSKRKQVTPTSANSQVRHDSPKGNRKPTSTAAAPSDDMDEHSDDIHLDHHQISDDVIDISMYERATVAVYSSDKDSEYVLVETPENRNAGKKMSKINAATKAKQQPMKTVECNICGETFSASNKRQFLDHQNIHSGHKPYACLVCETTFSCKSQLLDHHKMHKTDGRFRCEVCGRHCQSASALGEHMNVHTGAKPQQCTVCGKQYRTRGQLIIHVRSHTGERPYVCTECGRAFSNKTTLITHMGIHSEDGTLCPHCGKSFRQRGTLNMHVRIQHGNKPVSCDICGKVFKEKTYLKLHKKSHNKEISCPVCSRSFTRRYKMLNHVRKFHPDETPFKCMPCNLAFGTSDALNAHLDETHKGEDQRDQSKEDQRDQSEEDQRDQSEEVETSIVAQFVDGSGYDSNWNSNLIILIDGIDELKQAVKTVEDTDP